MPAVVMLAVDLPALAATAQMLIIITISIIIIHGGLEKNGTKFGLCV